MSKYTELQKLVESLEGDFEKFYDKGVGTAGTRVRKGLQEIGNMTKALRKDVTEVKAARKDSK